MKETKKTQNQKTKNEALKLLEKKQLQKTKNQLVKK